MLKQHKSDRDRRLEVLLKDFGYLVDGDIIIRHGLAGFTRDELVSRCRDIFDAAEKLCPIIHDDEYTKQFTAITSVRGPRFDVGDDAIPQQTVDSPAVQHISGVEVTHNEELNGIEIRFPAKPSQHVIDRLKQNGFRWSVRSKCWYRRRDERAIEAAAELAQLSA